MKWIKPTKEELDYANYSKRKRSTVFAKLCIIGTFAALIQGVLDFYEGFPYVMLIDLLIVIVLLSGYYINYKGKFHLAKLLIFILSNFILFIFAGVVPMEVGIYMLFFPLTIFYFISYDFPQRNYAFFFTVLSITLNGILLATNFHPFGSINLQPTDNPEASFAINLLLSFVLISLGIHFMIKLNHIGERLLLKKQEETEMLTQVVQDKNLSLEKTNQELDRFVYSTSHDLKSPLASVLGLLNLAKFEKEKIPESLATYLGMMEERINHLDGFIKDILDYSRNSRQELAYSKVVLSELINEVFLANRFLLNSEKIELSSDIKTYGELLLDKNRVFRVLNNLVSNAIKYSDLTKDKPAVCVSALIEKGNLILIVKDNGIGIEDEYKENIFDMFFRGTELADGSGLGLYIAREMVLKMNGLMKFESQFNEGSVFTVKIPLEKSIA